jgi:hypothetical protein
LFFSLAALAGWGRVGVAIQTRDIECRCTLFIKILVDFVEFTFYTESMTFREYRESMREEWQFWKKHWLFGSFLLGCMVFTIVRICQGAVF